MIVSSASSGPDLEAAVNYMYKQTVGATIGVHLKSILQQADIQVIAHGGSAADVANIVAAHFKDPDNPSAFSY